MMSKWNLFLAVLVFTVTTRGGARLNSNTVSESFGNALRRQDRFLGLLSIVRILNAACTAGSDTGTCYSRFDCLLHGGDPQGFCAQGAGVCCVTKLTTCGSVWSGLNTTYLQSTGYPDQYITPGTCTYIIKLNSEVCQVRLDIDRLALSPPDTMGVCQNDYFSVSQDNKFDKICGTTIDNHLYLSVDPNRPLIFTVHVSAAVEFRRGWKIRITQICCDQISMAPEGCGQYYTGETGTIKGLNYDAATTNNQYLSGLNYAICVRNEIDMCSTSYTEPLLFRPQCGDTLEWPTYDRTRGTQTQAACYDPTNSPVIIDQVTTIDLLGPHYFYLATDVDVTNTHEPQSQGVIPFNYFMTYQQNPCV